MNKESISGLFNNTCLFAKGILLNTGIEIHKLILESGDSAMIDEYNALSSNINLYNKLIEKPIKERFLNTDSLNRVIEQQEMVLAKESKAYGDYTHNLTVSWKDVQSKLGENDIAIEFLDFPVVNTDSTMYVALTLKKGYDNPHMVTLFERNQLKAIPENVYYTQTNVSDIIWKPLEEELKCVKDIYFAPSGELHKIGIEYLPISKTENICDVYTLHRLSSTRQLAVVQDESKGKNTILYGGINYDEKSNIISTDSASIKEPVLRSAFTYRANVDSLSLRNSYDYLEGTKKEADLIAEDMKQHSIPYNYYSGTDATEESFKHLDGTMPKVMHIATHGFYFTEGEAVKSQFARSEMQLLTDGGIQAGRIVEQKSMTRSGLLFSGCNRTVRHEKVPDEEEDGILTAQEISTLDLRGLDLVVLSACQTGLGDIVSGEGVFGLQRGFKKAGAKTIIMSLWNVNDESTMKMMTSFYHHYLEGMSKEEAFHAAQDELKKASPSQQERPDWAAFIMLDGLN
jgi:CHAT domain-containing protein